MTRWIKAVHILFILWAISLLFVYVRSMDANVTALVMGNPPLLLYADDGYLCLQEAQFYLRRLSPLELTKAPQSNRIGTFAQLATSVPVERRPGVICSLSLVTLFSITSLVPIGASIAAPIRKAMRHRRNMCLACGYFLHLNTSGICPECGSPAFTQARSTDPQSSGGANKSGSW